MIREFDKDQYVMNRKTGVAFRVTNGRLQSRGRYALADMDGHALRKYRTASSSLVPLTDVEATICRYAAKLLCNHHKRNDAEAFIISMYKTLQKRATENNK